MNDDFDAQQKARAIFDQMQAASLGTITDTGSPFVSLVTAAACGGAAVLLLSGLAMHTKNLLRDPRCSLLLVEAGGESGDPLAGARLTLSGNAIRLNLQEDQVERDAFLGRHASAKMYADFGDFSFYRIELESAHLVAGFGRIATIDPSAFR